MNNSPNDEPFISGIHIYCDRWCERCPFTDRCRVFAKEQESPDDHYYDMESVIRTVSASLAEAKQMLIEKAEELGIDPFSISDEEFDEIRCREKEFVEGDELSQLGERYWRSAKEILDGDFPQEDESLANALSVLSWYLFFIPVEIKCGLQGLLDEEGFEDRNQKSDPQGYANGKVKVSLIAVDRSLLAWNQLAEAGYEELARPVSELLESIRIRLENRFPLARDFVRPGFDEIEPVM